MNTENLCKALYVLPNTRIIARRESIINPIIIAISGVVILITNHLLVEQKAGAMSMALITLGTALILYGLLVTIMRANSQKLVPYDNDAKCYMKYRERYYDRELVGPIIRALRNGDINAIDQMPTTNIAAVTLAEYSSRGNIRAFCIYSFKEGEYQPLCEPTVVQSDR